MTRFTVRYPEENSVPQRCIDELRSAVETPAVREPLFELLEAVGRTTLVFALSLPTTGLDVVDDGIDQLIIYIGEDVMYGVDEPLGDYITHHLPRYCNYVLAEDSPEVPVP